jgi:hypothetical protein
VSLCSSKIQRIGSVAGMFIISLRFCGSLMAGFRSTAAGGVWSKEKVKIVKAAEHSGIGATSWNSAYLTYYFGQLVMP